MTTRLLPHPLLSLLLWVVWLMLEGTMSRRASQMRMVRVKGQRLGFQDHAVMGGLDPYLARWVNTAREESGPDHFARIDEISAAW